MSWGETLFLKKIIDGKKRLVESDNLYCHIISEEIIVGNAITKIVPNKIKFRCNGSVKLVFLSYNTATSHRYFKFSVYKNDELFKTYTENTEEERELILNVQKNDEFYFVVENTSSSGANNTRLKYLDIKADLIDGSGIDIIETEVVQ